MEKDDYYENRKFHVVVDCVVFGFDANKLKVLIRKRAIEPGLGCWTLCGAFLNDCNNLEETAKNAIISMTGIENVYVEQIKAYGKSQQDEEHGLVSVAYYSLINVADYDKELMTRYELKWVDADKVPQLWSNLNQVVEDGISLLRRKIKTEPIGFNLLPDLFTLTQLQHVYEAVLGKPIDKRNFRKRIKTICFIEKTDKIDKVSSKRGAALFRFNEKEYTENPTFKL